MHECLLKVVKQGIQLYILCRILRFVLQSITMSLRDNIYYQTECCAMGIPLTVNFPNVLITKLSTQLVKTFKSLHGYEPIFWLRFIDDGCFVWEGS